MINTILQFFSSSYYLYIYDLINNGSYLTLLHSSLQLIKNDQQLVLLLTLYKYPTLRAVSLFVELVAKKIKIYLYNEYKL
jgi:hypothetical protein